MLALNIYGIVHVYNEMNTYVKHCSIIVTKEGATSYTNFGLSKLQSHTNVNQEQTNKIEWHDMLRLALKTYNFLVH